MKIKNLTILIVIFALITEFITNDKRFLLYTVIGLDTKEIIILLIIYLLKDRLIQYACGNKYINKILKLDFTNIISNQFTNYFVYISSTFISIFVISFCIVCFFTNFDISDESYNLYYILNSNDIGNSYLIHYVLNYIWSLTGYKILHLRILYTFSIIFTNVYFCRISLNYFKNKINIKLKLCEKYFVYSSTVIASLFILCREPVWGYHQICTVLTVLFASFFMQYIMYIEKNKINFLLILFLCLTSMLALLIKFPIGFALIIASYLITHFCNYKSYLHYLYTTICYTFLILLFFYFNNEYIDFYLNNITNWSTGSHEPYTLIKNYIREIFLFFRFHIMQPLFVYFLIYNLIKYYGISKSSNQIALSFVKLIILAYISQKFIFSYDYFYIKAFHLNYSLYGTLLSLMIFIIVIKRIFSFKFLILYLLVIISILQATGTNTIFVHLFSNSLFPLFLFSLLLSIKYFEPCKFVSYFSFLLLCFLAFKVISYNQFTNFRRNFDNSKQTSESLHSSLLEGIQIEKDLASTIDSLYTNLDEINFSFEDDRIIPFADLAGLLVSVNAKAFGNPWIYTDAENTESFMDLGIANDIKKNDFKNIYLLQDTSSEYLQICNNVLTKYFELNNIALNRRIGEFYHHRNQHLSNLILIGPLIPLK